MSPVLSLLTLLHRPSCSPLFPYTTLFRSDFEKLDFKNEGCTSGNRSRRGDISIRQIGRNHKFVDPDRKSTRLNSSHVAISYAVFCLKKKKQTDEQLLLDSGNSVQSAYQPP